MAELGIKPLNARACCCCRMCVDVFDVHVITMVHKTQGCLLYRLCACPLISDMYVVEGPKACLANEEVSLGRFLEKGELGCQSGGGNASGWWLVV